MSDGSLSSRENLQRQEDEKICSCEKKRLEELIATNRQLVQATNEEMKQAKRLQVSVTRGHVTRPPGERCQLVFPRSFLPPAVATA